MASRAIGENESGKALPVNVTVIVEGASLIYGTRGDDKCLVDRLRSQPLASTKRARVYRVEASGFCTQPARAVNGSGAVLMSTFDFAGQVSFDDIDATSAGTDWAHVMSGLALRSLGFALACLLGALLPCRRARAGIARRISHEHSITLESASGGTHAITVWIADSPAHRAQGLMFVRTLAPDTGMLFLFPRSQYVSMWMKNTYVALDMLFVDRTGLIVNIAEDARPLTLDTINSAAPVLAVLELPAGTVKRFGLRPGDRLRGPTFEL